MQHLCAAQGPVKGDIIAHPCSSLHTWCLIIRLIFTLVFGLLLYFDSQQANTSGRLVRLAELSLLWFFFIKEPEVGSISHLLSQACT